MLTAKALKRRIRKIRNRLASQFFESRYGRELLVSALPSRLQTMTTDCGDHVMTFSPHDYIGRKIFRKGHFEREHVDRLLDILKTRSLWREGTALVELGGNIGTQTVYFALSGAYERIVSIEPDPRNFELLRINIAQNRLETMVTLVNCAAGESEGQIAFFQHQANHGKSSALRQSPSDREISVPVRPVSAILADTGITPPSVGLIWMDIEGYEPVACRSMEALMTLRVPLYMEFSPAFYGAEASAEFVRYLARFYTDCLVFSEDDDPVALKVAKMPIDRVQYDVLLLPV
ncbi:FkbM family methyltransferase [Pararhizobium antarcticum]|uniref:Methyltransferase n=1 Tax=Pararhizobium antarcticum TaxID=1798805 RepID=A0A657LNR1_9HYPH|nr:FkbM family methyltransferase [Pararhizobium antarcticum]OJF92403.1 methyltransferase [Pararhizobium antarcticum]OJF94915.1 methyltransferase [Rhizobium sp. 58]